MKTFKQHIAESWTNKIGELVFSSLDKYYTTLIPISEKMIERLFGKRRFRGYHVTIPNNLEKLANMQNSAKSISTMTSGHYDDFRSGIASGGGIVVELEGNLLISSYKDVFSSLELQQGRRWVKLESIADSESQAKKIYADISKELHKYISSKKIDFIKNGESYTNNYTYDNELTPWMAMYDDPYVSSTEVKDLTNGGWVLSINGKPLTGKDRANAIKFYFDTCESYIKKNAKAFAKLLFSGLDKKKGVGDEIEGITWNEHIINRFQVTHVFILSNVDEYDEAVENAKRLFSKAKIEGLRGTKKDIYDIVDDHVAKRAGLIN